MGTLTPQMVGLRIRDYLEDHGIKATFLIDGLGIHPTSMSMILNGKRSISVIEYFKICRILDVGYDEFLPEFRKGDE